jgi:hypothetical protein
MRDFGALWGLATILGPILLLAALAYGVSVYRKRAPSTRAITELATRELYRKADREEKLEETDSPPIAPDDPRKGRRQETAR